MKPNPATIRINTYEKISVSTGYLSFSLSRIYKCKKQSLTLLNIKDMKKFIIPIVAFMFVAITANANPRFKNQKHFGKDFDPNQKVEFALTTLATLNQGPVYKNQGHIYDAANGELVNVNNANTIKGPEYKNQKNFAVPAAKVQDIQPEIAMK